MASITDFFNYPDGALTAQPDWELITGAGIAVENNQISGTGYAAGFNVVGISTSSVNFEEDHEAHLVLSSVSNFDNAGTAVRCTPTNGGNCYLGYCDRGNNRVKLMKIVGGVSQEIAIWTGTVPNGGKIITKAAGTTITVAIDDGNSVTTVISVTDSAGDIPTGGQPGVYYSRGNSNGTRGDDFYAVDTGGATAGIVAIDASIDFGGTYNFVTNGMGTITERKLIDQYNNEIVVTGDDSTFSVPAWADDVLSLFIGAITLRVTDGTITANKQTTLRAPQGRSALQVEAGFSVAEGSYLYGFAGNAPVVGTEITYVPSDFNSIDAQGGYDRNASGTTTLTVTDPADGRREFYDLTIRANVPEDFTFTNLTDQTTSTLLESNIVTISGLASPVPIKLTSLANAEYKLNSNAYTTADGTINNGDTLQLRITSAATASASVSATVDLGGMIRTWTVQTAAPPPVYYTISQRLIRGDTTPWASTALDYAIFDSFAGSVVMSGQSTTDANGVFSVSNLTASGTFWLAIKNPSNVDETVYLQVTAA